MSTFNLIISVKLYVDNLWKTYNHNYFIEDN